MVPTPVREGDFDASALEVGRARGGGGGGDDDDGDAKSGGDA